MQPGLSSEQTQMPLMHDAVSGHAGSQASSGHSEPSGQTHLPVLSSQIEGETHSVSHVIPEHVTSSGQTHSPLMETVPPVHPGVTVTHVSPAGHSQTPLTQTNLSVQAGSQTRAAGVPSQLRPSGQMH
jgi:glycerate-2-kinase